MKKAKITVFSLLVIVILITAYFVFIKTDFYIPKPKRIVSEKGLAASIVKEVAKMGTTKDTLFLIVYNPSLICEAKYIPDRDSVKRWMLLNMESSRNIILIKRKVFQLFITIMA